jgi:hypothetical protein
MLKIKKKLGTNILTYQFFFLVNSKAICVMYLFGWAFLNTGEQAQAK